MMMLARKSDAKGVGTYTNKLVQEGESQVGAYRCVACEDACKALGSVVDSFERPLCDEVCLYGLQGDYKSSTKICGVSGIIPL